MYHSKANGRFLLLSLKYKVLLASRTSRNNRRSGTHDKYCNTLDQVIQHNVTGDNIFFVILLTNALIIIITIKLIM